MIILSYVIYRIVALFITSLYAIHGIVALFVIPLYDIHGIVTLFMTFVQQRRFETTSKY
jgi:hypothetical protein